MPFLLFCLHSIFLHLVHRSEGYVIADALRAELDRYRREAVSPSELGLAEASLAKYTASLQYIRRSAPRILARARDLATQSRLSELAGYYERRLAAEAPAAGDDLAGASDITAAAHCFVDYVRERSEEDTTLYLACNLFVQTIPTAASSPDGSPVRDSNEEELESIDQLISDPRKVTRLREVLRDVISLFKQVGNELARSSQPSAIELLERYPLPKTWSAVEVVEDTFDADGLKLRRAGLSSRSGAGEEILGSAAEVGESPLPRAHFELLERISTVEWLARRPPVCDLFSVDEVACGRLPSSEIVLESLDPSRFRYARSNGVALHGSWRSACRRAFWELCERDRILRAWYGETLPGRLSYDLGETSLAQTRNFEWHAYSFPGRGNDFSQDVHVVGVFGFPTKPTAPMVFGYGARPTEREAFRSATKEATQLLGFLWGEPLSATPPLLAPAPAYHLESYQRFEGHRALRSWLEGGHARFGAHLREQPVDATARVLYVDLTPPWLSGLRVAKAVCGAALPLVFGEDPNASHLPAALRAHPVA